MNLSTILFDFRQALRGLGKNVGTTILAVLMMALGIGASTAIFSVFYSVLLKPLPFPEPERILQIWQTKLHLGWASGSFTEANFWDVRARNRTFEEMGAYRRTSANLTGGGDPEQVSLGQVTAGFFQVLKANPVAGRIFLQGDDQPGQANQIVLLENEFWKRRFGGDRSIVGKSIQLNDRAFEVVGVLPPGEPWFNAANVFVPLVYDPKAGRGSMEFVAIGRMKPSVTMETARADLQSVAKSLDAEFPQDNKGLGMTVESSQRWLGGDDLRRALWVLIGAVGFLLLIACVNLTNLLLARATGRSRELVIRAALGASRGRLARLVLSESLLMCFFGASLGLLLAWGSIDLLKAANPGRIPRLLEVEINWPVLAFTLSVAAMTALLSALVPALRSPHANLMGAMREGERSQAGSRRQKHVRAALVATEVALSLILLVGAGLLLRSFNQLLRVERGFQTENRLMFSVNVPSAYNAERVNDLIQRFVTQAKSNPQVVSASAVSQRPILGGNPGMGIVSAERPEAFGASVPWAGWRMATPEYFRTMGVPLLQGRLFENDIISKPWRVIISLRLAEMLWPGENPVGRRALLWKGQGDNNAEIIGVVGNMRERGLESDNALTVYFPYLGAGSRPVQFVVHTAGDPAKQFQTLRSLIAGIDPNLPIANVQTLEEVVARSVAPRRFNMSLLSVFAGIALLLAMIGIYGVLAYSVARRTAEIGLRAALGATPGNILGMVVRQGMQPILIGIVIGLGGALWLSRFLTTLLYNIQPADPTTYAAVSGLVTLTALFSCYLPARRALRVDPVTALREE